MTDFRTQVMDALKERMLDLAYDGNETYSIEDLGDVCVDTLNCLFNAMIQTLTGTTSMSEEEALQLTTDMCKHILDSDARPSSKEVH